MTDFPSASECLPKRVPWNKGKIVGAKPPLRPKHVRVYTDEAPSRRQDARSSVV